MRLIKYMLCILYVIQLRETSRIFMIASGSRRITFITYYLQN